MSSSPQAAVSLEQNKQLILRWFDEVWNNGNRDAICQLFAVDAVLYDGMTLIRGPMEFEHFYDGLRDQFSDFHVTPVILLAEDDLVCMHWTASFKHTASGKPAQITGTSVARVKNGKFVEAWQNWDAAGLELQLK